MGTVLAFSLLIFLVLPLFLLHLLHHYHGFGYPVGPAHSDMEEVVWRSKGPKAPPPPLFLDGCRADQQQQIPQISGLRNFLLDSLEDALETLWR